MAKTREEIIKLVYGNQPYQVADEYDILQGELAQAREELARVKKMAMELAQAPTKALDSVLSEREKQEAKWGEQNHDPFTYLAILEEEVGEFAQAALQTKFGGKHGGMDNVRLEAVHTAAVALAIVECLDRGKWAWMPEPPKED